MNGMGVRSIVDRALSALSTSSSTAATRELGYGGPTAANWWGGLQEESTPELRWPLNLEVYDRMRATDTQVASVLRAVTMPVERTAWRLDPNGARDEVVAQISEDLGLPIAGADPGPAKRTASRFSWSEHLRLTLLDLTYGHMVFEQVYRLDERGKLRLHKLAPRMPRTISKWNVAPDGGLISITQDPPTWTSPTGRKAPTSVEIPVSRLVVYVNGREAGNWQGRSMLRPAYKFWQLKDRLLRVQAQTIERNGLGIPVYTGAPREDLAAGLKIATNWRAGEAAGAAIKYQAELALKGVEGDLPDAEPVIRYYDEQIARTFLAHALNLGTQTGSWALGTTFMDFLTLSLQTIAAARADTANEHVVEDLVDLNWGPDEPAPKIVFDEIGSRHPASAADLAALAGAGVLLPDRDLEQHVRQQLVLPPKGNYSTAADPAPDPAPDPGKPTSKRDDGAGARAVIAHGGIA